MSASYPPPRVLDFTNRANDKRCQAVAGADRAGNPEIAVFQGKEATPLIIPISFIFGLLDVQVKP